MSKKYLKISFCTVCLNRLHHLKKTLLKNIEDNIAYPKAQFIVLDYNSTDGLDEWINNDMRKYLDSKVLVYYKTFEPTMFHRSHSRNLSFKLADGEILCNVDADNYLGEDFACYVNEQFIYNMKIFLTPIDFHKKFPEHHAPSDTLGRVCFTKVSFYLIKGYSENMRTHGFQDYDFANRLEMAGDKRIIIQHQKFLTAESHDDLERYSNEPVYRKLKRILCQHLSPSESVLLYLYSDNTFEKGVIIDNTTFGSKTYKFAYTHRSYNYKFQLKESKWVQGKWEDIDSQSIRITFNNQRIWCIRLDTININGSRSASPWFEIFNPLKIQKLIMFNTHITNRNVMVNNWKKKTLITNGLDFGKATVYKNLDYSTPISI